MLPICQKRLVMQRGYVCLDAGIKGPVTAEECESCTGVHTLLPPREPRQRCQDTRVKPAMGPGDYLHADLRRLFGEDLESGCGCAEHILQMNAWGMHGCEENIDTIVQWLRDEAIKRGWSIVRFLLAGFFIKRFALSSIKKAQEVV